MPEIKTSLKQLTALFAQSSANEELPMPIRRFAAQLTVLTAHVNRVEAKIDALGKSADAHIAELVQHVAALQPQKTVVAPQPETGEAPAVIDEESGSEEDEAQELADRMLREADEEEMKNANAAAVAKVTPLRPNGQQTPPPTTEEAS